MLSTCFAAGRNAMSDVTTKGEALLAIAALLDQALALSDKFGEDALGAHLAHAQVCATERLKHLE
jgi:hypothetical protein